MNSAHTTDGDDPDLEAFESKFRAIIRAREIGKNPELVSNLRRKTSDP